MTTYEPFEPEDDQDGAGGGHDGNQDDQGGGDPHDGLVAGKTLPAVTYPVPFQASEMIPLLASSAAGSRASSLFLLDALLRAPCPIASSFSRQSTTTQTEVPEGEAPKLPASRWSGVHGEAGRV